MFVICAERRQDVETSGTTNHRKCHKQTKACCAIFQPTLQWKRTTRQTMLLAWNHHPRRSKLRRDNHWRQQSKPASSTASVEDATPCTILQGTRSRMRQQSKPERATHKEPSSRRPISTIAPSGPHNDKEEALKEDILHNVSLQFGKIRKQLMTFPVNHAVWGILLTHCMLTVLHLSQDDEELHRILKNHEVRKVPTHYRNGCRHN